MWGLVLAAAITLHPPTPQGYIDGILVQGLRVKVHLVGEVNLEIMRLAGWWEKMTGANLRVVSADDHIHMRNSAHYQDEAIDFQGDQLGDFAKWMRGWGYTVLWQVPGHYRHVHVQLEPLPIRHHIYNRRRRH